MSYSDKPHSSLRVPDGFITGSFFVLGYKKFAWIRSRSYGISKTYGFYHRPLLRDSPIKLDPNNQRVRGKTYSKSVNVLYLKRERKMLPEDMHTIPRSQKEVGKKT